jgi:hypothetical protein
MKYFKVCVTCGKDYEIDANPQTEQEYKNIQDQVGKKGGLCATCTNTNYYDDGSMDLKPHRRFVSSDGQYISQLTGQYLQQAEIADLYDRAMAVSLIDIAEKYNATITTSIQGQEGMEIHCDPKDAEAIEREILSYKRHLAKIRVYASMYGGKISK